MKLSKPIMSITQIVKETGMAKEVVMEMVNQPDQDFAWKTSGGGKWLIDTERFVRCIEQERVDQRRRRMLQAGMLLR
ncbi:MAG: hypothetical protein Q4C48_08815 [Lachnospiraceae bacterium]|nr:hypothetical protein [Lachnospiraceae bacterium]